MRIAFLIATSASVIVLAPAACARGESTEPARVDFNSQVRPLLSENCFHCHGPDESSREAGFRFDVREDAIDSGAITPGSPDESTLIERVLETDPELVMPPPRSHKTLSKAQIALLRRWIAEGAEYAEHWAFAPLPSGDDPLARGPADPGSIDRRVERRLEEQALRLRPVADRHTLIRRVTLDLIGVPPTREDVERFVNDEAPDAYERLVDRLLASPAYGEHQARFWLDAARYGDTHGLHLDNIRDIWPYRDWVISAFNENKPYDEFVTEQLAGDLLPSPTRDQLIATGFNRCNVTTNEGGSINKEVYTRNVMDRVDTFGTVFLGLTIGCAKCHDHKFDPTTQEDYYSLFAFFNSIDGHAMDGNRRAHAPVVLAPTEEQMSRQADLKERLRSLGDRLLRDDHALDAEQQVWAQELVERFEVLRNHGGGAPPNEEAGTQPEDAEVEPVAPVIFASDWRTLGPFSDNARYLRSGKKGPEGKPVDLSAEFKDVTGAPMRWRVEPSWIDGEPHRLLPGGVAANFLHRTLTVDRPTRVELLLGTDDGVVVYLNQEEVHKHEGSRELQRGEDLIALELAEGDNELLVRVNNLGGRSGFISEFADAVVAPSETLALAERPRESLSPEEAQQLRRVFRSTYRGNAQLVALQDELLSVRQSLVDDERETSTTLVYREREQPRPAFVLNRGEYDQEGAAVERRAPGYLPPLPEGAPRDRLGLAQWVTSPDNPLPSRVVVNRFWQQLFGVGLVQTADDFGSQSQPPSHPELLDRLAADFIASGWDVKAFFKRVVTSETYRQKAVSSSELQELDPDNRLLSRGPRFRLDAETLRDQALALSGLLVERIGGPPVRPPQPAGLWKAVAYSGSNTVRFVPDEEPDKAHRRTLYTFHKRTAPAPQMKILDGPTRESCIVRRERTNTPLQALLLMNDPQYVEAARALAERVLEAASEGDEKRASWLLEVCTCRPALPEEIAELVEAVQGERKTYRADVDAAERLIATGVSTPDPSHDPAELAAWTMAANLVLNLDEVVTKN